jgi:hypothetical protein
VACETGTYLRAAHPDQCTADDAEDSANVQYDNSRDSQEECKPKQYDLMKEELLLKSMCACN